MKVAAEIDRDVDVDAKIVIVAISSFVVPIVFQIQSS